MLFTEKTFTDGSNDEIAMRVAFAIAEARVLGADLLKITVAAGDEKAAGRIHAATVRTLRRLKKEGKVQVYLPSDDFGTGATEAVYLQNIFPDLAADPALCAPQDPYILVKP